jgi:hypothetical protein
VIGKNFADQGQRRRSVRSKPDPELFPVDAGNRAGFHGFLNAFHRAALRLKDLGFLSVFVQFEHFGTDIFTVAATDAFLFVNAHFFSHQRLRSNGWCDGDQGSQLAFRFQTVWLGDIANQHVPGSSRKGGAVFSKKLPDPFDDDNAHLAFNVVGVNGKFLTRLEIEIDDFKIGLVMHQKLFKGFFRKIVFFIKIDSLHCGLPF